MEGNVQLTVHGIINHTSMVDGSGLRLIFILKKKNLVNPYFVSSSISFFFESHLFNIRGVFELITREMGQIRKLQKNTDPITQLPKKKVCGLAPKVCQKSG
jgi:hypothetical protein